MLVGGDAAAKKIYEHPRNRWEWTYFKSCYPLTFSSSSALYSWHQWSIFQFVVVKALTGFGIAVVGEYYHHDELRVATLSLHAVAAVSILLLLRSILAVYWMLEEDLNGTRPVMKFIIIKLIIGISILQNFVFYQLVAHDVIRGDSTMHGHEKASRMLATLTIFEMVLFTFLITWAFSPTDPALKILPGHAADRAQLLPDDQEDQKKDDEKEAGAAPADAQRPVVPVRRLGCPGLLYFSLSVGALWDVVVHPIEEENVFRSE